MKRLAIAALMAALLSVGLTVPANAGSWHWSSPLCSRHTTDVPNRVCTQVRYYKPNAYQRSVSSVYIWWGGGKTFAYNVDDGRVYTGGRWYKLGSNLSNWTVHSIRGPRTGDHRCYVQGVLDGWAWFNAKFTHYHNCW